MFWVFCWSAQDIACINHTLQSTHRHAFHCLYLCLSAQLSVCLPLYQPLPQYVWLSFLLSASAWLYTSVTLFSLRPTVLTFHISIKVTWESKEPKGSTLFFCSIGQLTSLVTSPWSRRIPRGIQGQQRCSVCLGIHIFELVNCEQLVKSSCLSVCLPACLPYHIISYHTIPYHIIYHIIIISYHTISYHIIYHIISYHNIHIISYHIISYRIVSYRIISYHTIPYHTIPYHTISYFRSYDIMWYDMIIISYHIISYHIISYHIISYHIIFHIHKTYLKQLLFLL